jgi:hypothetical protein
MASREADPVLTSAILVQAVDEEREIAVYSHECLTHPEGYRTAFVLMIDRGEVVDQYGRRLSA